MSGDTVCGDLTTLTIVHRHIDTNFASMKGEHRRISCKDLGGGDCQGWLLMKKTDGGFSVLRSKWNKFWFVLTKKNLFYYQQPSVRYLCFELIVFLCGFCVSHKERSVTIGYCCRFIGLSQLTFNAFESLSHLLDNHPMH